jgi:hypothetical protein
MAARRRRIRIRGPARRGEWEENDASPTLLDPTPRPIRWRVATWRGDGTGPACFLYLPWPSSPSRDLVGARVMARSAFHSPHGRKWNRTSHAPTNQTLSVESLRPGAPANMTRGSCSSQSQPVGGHWRLLLTGREGRLASAPAPQPTPLPGSGGFT